MASPISATSASATYIPAAQTSQIQQLYQQGVSPAEIAAMLGLSTAAVDGYLGIGAPAVVALPTLAETPAVKGPTLPRISTFG
jgi:Putative ATPase subunit of terminase (gpP-like)